MVFYGAIRSFHVQQSTTNGYGDCVRSVVRSQLTDQILDVEVHRGFGDRQLICDLLVAETVRNQPEDL